MTTFLALTESCQIQTVGIDIEDCIVQLEKIGNFTVMAKHEEDAEGHDWKRVDITVGDLNLPAAEIDADTDYSGFETRKMTIWIEQQG